MQDGKIGTEQMYPSFHRENVDFGNTDQYAESRHRDTYDDEHTYNILLDVCSSRQRKHERRKLGAIAALVLVTFV